MISFIIYIIIIIFYIIWNLFGKSLYNIHRYHNRLLFELNWNIYNNLFERNSMKMLKSCVLSTIICTDSKYLSEKYYIINGLSYTKKNKKVGIIIKKHNHFIISLTSTGSLSDIFTSASNNYHYLENTGNIHEGYYNYVVDLYDSVLKYLTKYSEINKIYITGHSMGGSVGIILGYLLTNSFRDMLVKTKYNISVFTFGSPRIGDKNSKKIIEKSINIYNYINDSDIIPKKLSEKYCSIGNEIIYKIDTGNDNINHGIKAYRECILKVKNSQIKKRNHRFDELLSRYFVDLFN